MDIKNKEGVLSETVSKAQLRGNKGGKDGQTNKRKILRFYFFPSAVSDTGEEMLLRVTFAFVHS